MRLGASASTVRCASFRTTKRNVLDAKSILPPAHFGAKTSVHQDRSDDGDQEKSSEEDSGQEDRCQEKEHSSQSSGKEREQEIRGQEVSASEVRRRLARRG